MTKKLVAIPEGNLLRIAATKSVATLTALKEKTGVDRKTLRAINTGRPVKETTLQGIADKLRVPLAHLLGPSTLDDVENGSSLDTCQFREITLQRLDAGALRRLAEENAYIFWLLKIDQMSESLEATLLKLDKSLIEWWRHVNVLNLEEAPDNLVGQISYIKTSADIDKCVEQLAKENLKIYGGTYIFWDKRPRHPSDDQPPLILQYISQTRVALSIAPEEKNNSTVRVATGWEPPQGFSKSELPGIESVEIDGRQVWSRDDRADRNSEIPF
jgi:hypothetical protein